jgi:hypothetical protein
VKAWRGFRRRVAVDGSRKDLGGGSGGGGGGDAGD